MGIRSFLSKLVASSVVAKQQKWMGRPVETQNRVFLSILEKAGKTAFGKDHLFHSIKDYNHYKKHVPIRDYEGFKSYVERIKEGERDVLWPGLPAYFAKTSGTTSGVKYIPITKDSIPFHINGARDALLNYIFHTGRSSFLDKKMIFLSGSPEMQFKNGIHIGRLSGIVNHHIPSYLRGNQMPSFKTNCIEDWETKLEHIIEETLPEDLSLISGIPPWVQMYFDRIYLKTGRKIKDIFPSFSLLVYGGVNVEPYKNKLIESIGKEVDTIETYPASEGFIAFQDLPDQKGLLLLLNSGIFYEFIPAADYFAEEPLRLTIGEVELHVQYALVLTTNAGLYAYSIGDTVKFVSKNPYRIVVTGRIKHFISAFGEHVIGEEVEKAMKHTLARHPHVSVTEFTVAPQVNPADGLPYHEWLVEFAVAPADLSAFASDLDREMIDLNIYYKDLIAGSVLRPLVLTSLEPGRFIDVMKEMGKLGGQNKTPRLSNDRVLADLLVKKNERHA